MLISLVIILVLLSASSGCSSVPAVVLMDDHQIRTGRTDGWVEIQEGYLRAILMDMEACDQHFKSHRQTLRPDYLIEQHFYPTSTQ